MAEERQELLMLSRETTEDVLGDHDSLLDRYRLAILDNISDDLNSLWDSLGDLQDDLANRFDTGSDEVQINVVAVVLEFS